MFNNTKKSKELTSIDIGVCSIIMGSIASNLLCLNPVISTTFFTAGFGSFAYHVIYKNNKFEKLWRNCNLHNKDDVFPKLREKKNTSYGYCLRFSLPIGLSSNDFIKHQQSIEQYLNKKVKIKYKHQNILIEVYEQELKQDYDFELIKTKSPVSFPIGYSFGNKMQTVDLSNSLPHMLIAGETGSGKSTVLRSIVTTLIATKNPKMLKIHLIDMKNGAEFNIFQGYPIVKTFSRNKKQAEKVLYQLSDEVDKRYNLFFQTNCVDIQEYNQNHKKKLNYQIVIIDEFADLQNEKGSISIIEQLVAKARACGIHLIISTQRPDSKILNGRIKANCSIILGLKTMNEVNSRIIIDHGGLEHLRGRGHGILKVNNEIEVQSMNLSPKQARDILKSSTNRHRKSSNKATFKKKKFDNKTKAKVSDNVIKKLF